MGASNFGRLDLANHYYVFAETEIRKGFNCSDCGQEIYEYEIPSDTSNYTCPYCETQTEVPSEEELETFYYSPEQYEVEDELNYICEVLSSHGAEDTNPNDYNKIAVFKSQNKEYAGVDIQMCFEVHVETGYHDGARLDFKAYIDELYNNNEMTFEEIEDRITDLLESYSDKTDKVIALRTKQAVKWAKKEFDKCVEKINMALEQAVPTKMIRVGGFSDGTSVYQTI